MSGFPWGNETVWHRRLAYAATFIPRDSHVLDLGCGKCDLLRYLPRCHYRGYDLAKYSDEPRAHVADLSTWTPPDEGYEYVVALGLLEYLVDPGDLLRRIRPLAPWLVVSAHRPRAEGEKEKFPDRPQRANQLGIEGVRAKLEKLGWMVVNQRGDQVQKVFLCRRVECG